jgi:hypothetical protein
MQTRRVEYHCHRLVGRGIVIEEDVTSSSVHGTKEL